MAGLDPAIHVEPFGTVPGGATWMPGTSPGMTRVGTVQIYGLELLESVRVRLKLLTSSSRT
ncbi:protein of unknown function [Magnetospirillum sp. XM-1]|nr:protein of unknown function [Magnetospirillum sp. XM-1]